MSVLRFPSFFSSPHLVFRIYVFLLFPLLTFFSQFLVLEILKRGGNSASAQLAVGQAAFFGYPKKLETLALAFSLLWVSLLGALIGLLFLRRVPRVNLLLTNPNWVGYVVAGGKLISAAKLLVGLRLRQTHKKFSTCLWGHASWLFVRFPCLVVAVNFSLRKRFCTSHYVNKVTEGKEISLLILSSVVVFFFLEQLSWISVMLVGTSMTRLTSHFDQLIGDVTQYRALYDWLPYRDFWDAYGGGFFSRAPLPWDRLLGSLHRTFVIAVMGWTICQIGNWKSHRLFILLGGLLLAMKTNVLHFNAIQRYFLSLDCVLYFCALGTISPKRFFVYFFGGLILGWAFAYEVSQFLYALPSILLLIIFQFCGFQTRGEKREWIISLFVLFLTFLSFVGLYFLHLYHNGQWVGYVDFWKSLSAWTAMSSVVLSIDWLYHLRWCPNSVFWFGIPILIGYGFFSFITDSDIEKRRTSATVIALGVLAFAYSYKFTIRPEALELTAPIIIGLILIVFQWVDHTQQGETLLKVGGFTVGCLFLLINFSSIKKRVEITIERLPESVGLLLANDSWIQSSSKLEHFSTIRYVGVNGENRAIFRFLLKERQLKPKLKVYVLGNENYFYMILKQKPPYYITPYDSSTVLAQSRVVDWLQKERPEYVIWNDSHREVDSVPDTTRIPLIFSEITTHYTTFKTIDNYKILRRSDNKTDLPRWREILGSSVDLGALPSASNFHRLGECFVSSEICHNFLKIEILSQPIKDRMRSVSLAVSGIPFQVKFREREGITDYHVSLDRLWFWSAAKARHLKREVISSPGTRFTAFNRVSAREVLY